MIETIVIKDVSFPFRYIRPRLLGVLAIFLAGYGLWLAMDPTRIDVGYPTGLLDLSIRQTPPLARSLICCAFSAVLLASAYVTYWPCIRSHYITIFDGRNVYGFDRWGNNSSLLRSEITSVGYRYGGASVRGENNTVWIPLSLLDLDESGRNDLKAFLTKAIS